METDPILRRNGSSSGRIVRKCNIAYICTTSGIIQSVELMLPFLGTLFVTIQLKDTFLIDLSVKWVILQAVLLSVRLLPFLFYDAERSNQFKRVMSLYEFGITVVLLVLFLLAIPILLSEKDPRTINVMVYIVFGILLNLFHIGWIIYKLIYEIS